MILKKSSFFRVFAAHAYSRECKNKEYDLTMWNDQLNFFFSKIERERERELEILTAILRFPRLLLFDPDQTVFCDFVICDI